jgi:hypothetical protein
VTESTEFQLWAEPFTVFDNGNFNTPQNTAGAPNFGFIASARIPEFSNSL